MRKCISNYVQIILINLCILCPQNGFSSDTDPLAKVPLKNFVTALFSDEFKENRALALVLLSEHGNTQTLYQTSLFQTALGEMDEEERNAFIISLPSTEKDRLKRHMHWSLLATLGQAELKSVAASQKQNQNIAGPLDDLALKDFFGKFFSPDATPPAHDAPFLKKYFYEQRDKGKNISEDLARVSGLLRDAEPRSEHFYYLTGQLNFLSKVIGS